MNKLETTYMGLTLKNPLIIGSSNLTASLSNIKKLEQAGAGAIVLKFLFEEQFLVDEDRLLNEDDHYYWYREAIDYLNNYSKNFGVKEYIQLIRDAKKEVSIPIIASINCVSAVEWPKFALQLEYAGADGIELNISVPAFQKDLTSEQIESNYADILLKVKSYVSIPVSVKIGANFTNITRLAHQLAAAGADGIVLFNRFYSPDIDIYRANVISDKALSNPVELAQSLRWIGLLSKEVKTDFAASTGIHDSNSIIKQILAGAAAVQVVSAIYENGVDYAIDLVRGVDQWMKLKGYNSIDEFKGLVAIKSESAAAFERVQYMKKSYSKM